MEKLQIINADVIEGLRSLDEGSVHCVVTSPPYWGLRDYGVEGMIGLEPTFQEWLDRMVEVCGEIRRVLRDDGTFWLNVGDAMASGKGTCFNPGGGTGSLGKVRKEAGAHPLNRGNESDLNKMGFKPKDLLMMPARLAIALQADGWWLRSDIIWSKPNPMPESVTDRPTSAHEHIFLLTKRARYFYDADAVREDSIDPESFNGRKKRNPQKFDAQPFSETRRGFAKLDGQCYPTRNLRNVWTIPTQPYPEAHFATFPQKLVEKCIMAGCPQDGIVLDPFAGSGTTLYVARKLGRKAIGIELNPEYCKLIEKRLSQEFLF